VKHAQPFLGQLPDFGSPQVIGNKPPQKFVLYSILENILKGYDNQIIRDLL
jgi:acetyl-CoA carboxylase/biotin carboxylase 1